MEESRPHPLQKAYQVPAIADAELRFLGQVGAALWAEAERGATALEEAIELANMTNRRTEGRGETAARTLLDRARAAGTLAFRGVVADPFWRLPLELRFLLAATHGPYRASYARLHRILSARVSSAGAGDEEPEKVASQDGDTAIVQQLLWSARTQFAAAVGLSIPAGAAPRSPSCPEYRPREPWTQRFLDDELTVRERLFLQNHLMSCEGCRTGLDGARKLIGSIEAQLARRGVLASGVGFGTAGLAEVPLDAASIEWPNIVLWASSFAGVAVLLLLLWTRG